jgi:hypothetical protein
MPSAAERADVSDETITSIIRMTRIGELGTTIAATSNQSSCEGILYLDESSHPDDGGDTFLRNIVSYKSHTA